MLHSLLGKYRRLVLLGTIALPAAAAGGCTPEQWLVPVGLGIAGFLGLQFLQQGA